MQFTYIKRAIDVDSNPDILHIYCVNYYTNQKGEKMVLTSTVIIGFLISLVISALIIYVVTKLFGETEGFGTAIITALIGSIIYAVAFFFLGSGVWAAALGGIAWLIALGTLYKIGWIKALGIAIIVWLISSLVSYVLPTLNGPI